MSFAQIRLRKIGESIDSVRCLRFQNSCRLDRIRKPRAIPRERSGAIRSIVQQQKRGEVVSFDVGRGIEITRILYIND